MKLPFLPKKEWGQNFLLDKNLLQKIVDSCPFDKKTIIVEIGSGYGHLTEFLAKSNCHQVISYEKDAQLHFWLQSKWKEQKNKVIFLYQDALKINWPELRQKYNQFLTFLVVGNLPYSIANSLIFNLLESAELFENLVFLIQKEVAQRWVATPQKYKKEYSALSVYISLITKPEIIFFVPKQCFFPQPSVDGALVRLEIKKEIQLEKEKRVQFWAFLKNCFRHRRKTLWNNLLIASYQEKKIREVFQKLKYEKNIRPQQLTIQDYLSVFNFLQIELK
ncbi:16S rRNA (adenine(1518)-N(6)/adenine(1519)-N(6))-dimethyltransferase RsmA [endosymbiont GvMRE of Glomus versiforme]|uniref:16S rRNA (adenine(1518)-N(6)/adenine(1519)-N(6))- dimethyltransferase RsmA n=1 Tax=endosymbiont GvMRE of Glomus versiforme TaxID=2039283 RepID=UPI000ED88EC4|nr:16S rRNA (adenine(1518)-N(6)/adenine(1519)-N(6))-dimethyltransferase RsmA [endosymbiont GvMRE of Glomus versiforme]RHZ36782.1 Ribosomal RNA small subunit methyltransferase A [endosymbiont GvMRE of Glomus versiforme]